MANITRELVRNWEMKGIENLQSHWVSLMILGILLTILGFFAISTAMVATVVSVMFLGGIFLAGGVTQVFHGFAAKCWGGVFGNIIVGLFYILAGTILILNPGIGAASITLALGAFFIISGLIRAMTSAVYRYPSWGWCTFSGLVSIALGAWVLVNWPVATFWLIGLFVGIDLVFAGVAMTTLASAARNFARLNSTVSGTYRNTSKATV